MPRFVIQEHKATNLHWDLRLEHEGVAASYDLEKWEDDKIVVEFHGTRLDARYALIRTDGKNWLLLKERDALQNQRAALQKELDWFRPSYAALQSDRDRLAAELHRLLNPPPPPPRATA